jgi:hypothetical protein
MSKVAALPTAFVAEVDADHTKNRQEKIQAFDELFSDYLGSAPRRLAGATPRNRSMRLSISNGILCGALSEHPHRCNANSITSLRLCLTS